MMQQQTVATETFEKLQTELNDCQTRYASIEAESEAVRQTMDLQIIELNEKLNEQKLQFEVTASYFSHHQHIVFTSHFTSFLYLFFFFFLLFFISFFISAPISKFLIQCTGFSFNVCVCV